MPDYPQLTVRDLKHFLKAYGDDTPVIVGDVLHGYFAQVDGLPMHARDELGREVVCLHAGRPTNAKVTENVIYIKPANFANSIRRTTKGRP